MMLNFPLNFILLSFLIILIFNFLWKSFSEAFFLFSILKDFSTSLNQRDKIKEFVLTPKTINKILISKKTRNKILPSFDSVKFMI